jgi:hypothetical protein
VSVERWKEHFFGGGGAHVAGFFNYDRTLSREGPFFIIREIMT